MMKRFTQLIAVAAVFAVAGVAHAATVQHTYYFTAADMLQNQFVSGADGSSAADNQLFDGATLLRVGTSPTHADAARTYVASQHNTFNTRWDALAADDFRLRSFNLWGLDGRGVGWGEDYKPFTWVDVSTPDGWTSGYHEWPLNWGALPAGYHTDRFPWFQASSWDDAIGLTGDIGSQAYNEWLEDLEALRFSVTIEFDPADAWWGADTNGAPNTLGSDITMWWGGHLYDSSDASHMIEGNFTAVVPVPPAAGLILLGMAGLGLRRKFARK